jgi:hypothetical protein
MGPGHLARAGHGEVDKVNFASSWTVHLTAPFFDLTGKRLNRRGEKGLRQLPILFADFGIDLVGCTNHLRLGRLLESPLNGLAYECASGHADFLSQLVDLSDERLR